MATLTEAERERFLALEDKYDAFGWLMMSFTPYSGMFPKEGLPALPLRDRLKGGKEAAKYIPDSVLDAVGYREFLAAAVDDWRYGDRRVPKALKTDAI